MSDVRILGVLTENRSKAAHKVQEILTKYGCSIRTRLGLHDFEQEGYEDTGLIILELTGNDDECLRLENELLSLEETQVKKMNFPALK